MISRGALTVCLEYKAPDILLGSKPWRIIETFQTTDGMRSRLTANCFKTEQEAWNRVKQLEECKS